MSGSGDLAAGDIAVEAATEADPAPAMEADAILDETFVGEAGTEADTIDLEQALGELPGDEPGESHQGPRNASHAGEVLELDDPVLQEKYPEGVQFDEGGFPDFSPYAQEEVQIDMIGDHYHDYRAAEEAAGLEETPIGYTWHHHQDRTTMQLVPTDLHRTVGHTGGVGMIKQIGRLE